MCIRSSTPTARTDRGTDHGVEGVLEAVCKQLVQRGWTARVVQADLFGEPETRVLVHGADVSVCAELLGPCDSVPLPDRWYAVGVAGGQRRTWRGPTYGCTAGELVGDLEHLLHLLHQELGFRARWQEVG